MKRIDRRNFVKTSVLAGAGLYTAGCLSSQSPMARVRGANEDIRMGMIAVGNQGTGNMKHFAGIDGVRIVAVCDPDTRHMDRAVAWMQQEKNSTPKKYQDLRALLDDPEIDAVCVATCNHWHALATVWACQAGKDVYCEKPISHNVWEGRQSVAAARKYNRIVQTGTQNRSDPGCIEAFQYMQDGNLGKILLARGLCYKRRASIGKVAGPQPIPAEVDYDLYQGPAPMVPLMRKDLHYDWHWQWPTGNGDIGNQGIHEMDLCRWVCGYPHLAPRVMSVGGRFGYVDDGETPNTLITFFDYQPVPIIFEVRGLPRRTGEDAMDNYRNARVGVIIECEGGYFSGGRFGGWIYDKEGNKVKQFAGTGGPSHQQNFIDAVRSRKVSELRADIQEGHLSSALCHMANITYRLGEEAGPGETRERMAGNKDALETYERMREHLSRNSIRLDQDKAHLGPWLTMNLRREQFEGEMAHEANQLATRDYRRPFVVPKRV